MGAFTIILHNIKETLYVTKGIRVNPVEREQSLI